MKTITLLAMILLMTVLIAGCDRPNHPKNAEEMKDKLSGKVSMAMWKVDATKEQKKQMDKMLDKLAIDLFAFQQEDKAIKREVINSLYKEPIDQPKLKELQKKGLSLFDRYMQRMFEAAIDSSKILNLEQRRELLDLWRNWEFTQE